MPSPARPEPATGMPQPAAPVAAPDGELSMDGVSRWMLSAVPAVPDRVPYVRRHAVAVLELWGLRDLLWVVELMLTELVANAVRHAGTPFTVVMSWNGRGLRCEVSDADPRPPRPQLVPDPEGTGGRGLLLVDRLAGSWGTDLRRQGKTIWFEVRRS
jgi:anti-sigma regulatory factor (Ser/Thr protein kinase)